MRSHVTLEHMVTDIDVHAFQYRKRYEVTCDSKMLRAPLSVPTQVSIPQAV